MTSINSPKGVIDLYEIGVIECDIRMIASFITDHSKSYKDYLWLEKGQHNIKVLTAGKVLVDNINRA